ncbi:NUDIX hydrolase [Nocardioides terrisoli]|uniref:NUDIX hydrolase n=1 Tax=Nocardioides terrisoli TaxID=3388267 RepID=UPI00287B7768|nr:NUDIX domain-containing protein [Nocardioides marmorisolisilvae]
MGRRIDYLDDPNAPAANTLIPSVNTIVENDQHQILLIRRTDNDRWSLPGGKVDLGESLIQAAVRETREETGIDCNVTGIAGIYSNPRHLIEYTSNGEVRQEFTIVLTARAVGGSPTPSAESSHVEWVHPLSLDEHPMHSATTGRIHDFLSRSVHLD